MPENDLRERTKKFALRVIRLVEVLPVSTPSRVIANQLCRCGTSVAANYRASCKARSRAEFIAKIGIVEEEADECLFWLEMICEAKLLSDARVRPLMQEANELTSIMAASRKTAKRIAATAGPKQSFGIRHSAFGISP